MNSIMNIFNDGGKSNHNGYDSRGQSSGSSRVRVEDVSKLQHLLEQIGMNNYSDQQLIHALKTQDCNPEKAVNHLLSSSQNPLPSQSQMAKNQSYPPVNNQYLHPNGNGGLTKSKSELVENPFGNQQYMQSNSLKKAEPIPQNERVRDYSLPVGLKNIGNSKFVPFLTLSLQPATFHR